MKKWSYLLALLILLQALSTALYLRSADPLGFPLDDAWIHQTYARNLGLHGLMAFSPGVPSTGSTSAGWTAILAAGYFLNVPFLFWAYLWGSIFAVATAFTAAHLSFEYFGNLKSSVGVAVMCILEWHLAWASVSGMEISLFTFLSLLFLLLLHRRAAPHVMGLVAGFTLLVRPEASLLILLYGIEVLLKNRLSWIRFFSTSAIFLGTFLTVISPWVIFNLNYSGRPFPSTISSKFMQYGYPFSIWNSLGYLGQVFLYFWNGPLMLLVPCAALAVTTIFRRRTTELFYTLAWPLILVLVYAVTLPSIYHHGRYLMHLIPIVIILGIRGLEIILKRLGYNPRLQVGVWLIVGGMMIPLWINGSSTFALQIRLLTDHHAQAARWVAANTPAHATIATHDIGLVGYITQRQIVDLAGLVTPEVIPIMRDQAKLAEFAVQKNVTYVIVFTGYYEDFLQHLKAERVYSPHRSQALAFGLEPFEVFKIAGPRNREIKLFLRGSLDK